jgi:hypothetical protein
MKQTYKKLIILITTLTFIFLCPSSLFIYAGPLGLSAYLTKDNTIMPNSYQKQWKPVNKSLESKDVIKELENAPQLAGKIMQTIKSLSVEELSAWLEDNLSLDAQNQLKTDLRIASEVPLTELAKTIQNFIKDASFSRFILVLNFGVRNNPEFEQLLTKTIQEYNSNNLNLFAAGLLKNE